MMTKLKIIVASYCPTHTKYFLIMKKFLLLIAAVVGMFFVSCTGNQVASNQSSDTASVVDTSSVHDSVAVADSLSASAEQVAEDAYDEAEAKAFATKFFKKTGSCHALVGENKYMTPELYNKCKPLIKIAINQDPGEDPFFTIDRSEVKLPSFAVKSLGDKEFECKECYPSEYDDDDGYFVTKSRIKVDKINGKYVVTNIFNHHYNKKCYIL